MKLVRIKLEHDIMNRVRRAMKTYHYVSKAEFIRDAIRNKIRKHKLES